jgi:hypothetical protein
MRTWHLPGLRHRLPAVDDSRRLLKRHRDCLASEDACSIAGGERSEHTAASAPPCWPRQPSCKRSARRGAGVPGPNRPTTWPCRVSHLASGAQGEGRACQAPPDPRLA